MCHQHCLQSLSFFKLLADAILITNSVLLYITIPHGSLMINFIFHLNVLLLSGLRCHVLTIPSGTQSSSGDFLHLKCTLVMHSQQNISALDSTFLSVISPLACTYFLTFNSFLFTTACTCPITQEF